MKGDISGSRRKVAVIMAGAVTLSISGAFVTLGIDKLVGFMLHYRIRVADTLVLGSNLIGLSYLSISFDLTQNSKRQSLYRNTAAGRLRGEISGIYFVETLEILHISQEARCLEHF